MTNYRIPKEITTELKINKALYLTDLLFMVVLLVLAMMLGNIVYPALRVPFYCFVGLVGFAAIVRPYTNPKKRLYQAVMLVFVRRKDTYCSIDRPTEEME